MCIYISVSLAGLLPRQRIIFHFQTSIPLWGAWELLSVGEKSE